MCYNEKRGDFMKLAIDAMSGDLGSPIVVEACLSFLSKNKNVELHVAGKPEELVALKDHPMVTIVEASEVLDMNESIMAIRRKKDSSMVASMMMARRNEVDGVVSCGNTGAYYACAMLFVKRIQGVEKSALMVTMPTLDGNGVLMLDVGANATNTPEQLQSFGIMANIYAKNVLKIKQPRVGLLNIGTEHHKGDEVHVAAFGLLNETEDMNFIGNIEGKHAVTGEVDIIVTDGFSGNICLKTLEGTASVLMKAIKKSLMASLRGKIGGLIIKKPLGVLKHTFNPDTAGGALLIGFEKPIVKAHGGSNAIAFENAMHLVVKMIENDVVEKIKTGLE